MDRFQIAAALRDIAAWLRFQGDKGYRARAYENGAAAVEATPDLLERARSGELTGIKFIGTALAKQIEEMLANGHSAYLDELRGGLPSGLARLADAARISPAKAVQLYRELGIENSEQLLEAAKSGRLSEVKGFGGKTAERIAAALSLEPAGEEKLTVDDAWDLADDLSGLLRGAGVEEVAIAGELRRAEELIETVSLVGQTGDSAAVISQLGRSSRVAQLEDQGSGAIALSLAGGGRARIRLARKNDLAEALFEDTGPAAHVAEVLRRARNRGARPPGSTAVDEAAIYAAAGLPFIPPELRAWPEILATADGGETFSDLIQPGDLRGAVHCHSTYSDGKNSIEEMARAAEKLGYQFITITDHSPTAHYAGGLDLERLERQHEEIAAAQERVSIRILRGTESDITKDGALDYPDEVLERLDVIVASIHNRYRLDAQAMTERVVRAMKLPVFKIWGHALGRILNHREPYACDLDRILDAAASARVAIEINGDPNRLDLPPDLIPLARARGIPFVISADAHSTRALRYLEYGVAIARRGGVRRDEVLNALPAEAFIRAVKP